MLSAEQRAQYDRDGFIVLPGFKNPEQIAALRARAEAIVDAFDPNESRAIFTTRDQERARAVVVQLEAQAATLIWSLGPLQCAEQVKVSKPRI
jgi:hypothetical protein